MNLSKSKYCNAIQCKKMLWLDTNKSDVKSDMTNESVLDNGVEVGEIARRLFGQYESIPYNEDLNIMIEDTKKALLQDNIVITEASFLYDNNFCSVDILKKTGNEIEIYEVKSSTNLKDIYIEDVSYQTYILLNLGYNIKKVCIAYINSSYERNLELELDKLFTIKDVTDIVFKNQENVKKQIKDINEYMMKTNEPEEKLNINCSTPYECPFFSYCTKDLPKDNIFKLKRIRNKLKFDLYNKDIYTYNDLLNENIDWKVKQQIEFELYDKKPMILKDEIKKFLDNLTYPLYFLDFETYQQPIPQYMGVKPYMQIPFQYSLHYLESENDKLKHKEFLAEANEDPRRKLAEQLVKDIPKNVCTLAYNMGFEKSVIKNLAKLFPDLEEHLMNIHDNIKDLMIPFINRYYYTKEMKGSYSIKYVLPALFPNDPTLNYHNLDLIHNGSEAMNAYANLGKLSKDEQIKVRENLLKYCELDTYAMVKIWLKLKEISNYKLTIENESDEKVLTK